MGRRRKREWLRTLAFVMLGVNALQATAACVVTSEKLEAHDSPNGSIVATFQKGDVMRTIEIDGEWARISKTGSPPQWVVWKGNLEGYACGEPTYGTADTGDWYHDVAVDPMDDTASCMVSQYDSEKPFAALLFESSGNALMRVVTRDFPSKPQAFRVDKNPSVEGSRGISGQDAQRIIEQIEGGGKKLLARYSSWPDGESVVLEYTLAGIIPEIRACRDALASK